MKLGITMVVLLTTGCSLFSPHALPPPTPPLKILVAQVTLDAPVTSPTDLYSVHERTSLESQAMLLGELIDEIELKGQRILTEQLANQPGFSAIPFAEARRLHTNIAARHAQLDQTQLRTLGIEAQVHAVLSGHILDYGVVQWQYWVPGLGLSMLIETLIAGAATGFNPVIMAATAGSELLTDVPFWWGGAYVAGWALRPVQVQIEALPVIACEQDFWQEKTLVMLVPWKTLADYPPEERRRKDVQLEVNLTRALTELAQNVGREFRLQPCE